MGKPWRATLRLGRRAEPHVFVGGTDPEVSAAAAEPRPALKGGGFASSLPTPSLLTYLSPFALLPGEGVSTASYLAAVDASFLMSGAQVVVMDPPIVPPAAVASLWGNEVHFGFLHDVGGLGWLWEEKDSLCILPTRLFCSFICQQGGRVAREQKRHTSGWLGRPMLIPLAS